MLPAMTYVSEMYVSMSKYIHVFQLKMTHRLSMEYTKVHLDISKPLRKKKKYFIWILCNLSEQQSIVQTVLVVLSSLPAETADYFYSDLPTFRRDQQISGQLLESSAFGREAR